jgi:hypothetical protein
LTMNWKKYGSGRGIIYDTILELFSGGIERKTKAVSH